LFDQLINDATGRGSMPVDAGGRLRQGQAVNLPGNVLLAVLMAL
jgi:hypothetical protein